MEFVNAKNLASVTLDASQRDFIKQTISKEIDDFHAKGFVHGDLRTNNILVALEDKISVYIVDFDWSGKKGTATYPFFINQNIPWPPEAADGAVITPEHDNYWVDRMFK